MPEDRRIDTKETLENQHSSFDFRYVNCVPIETRSDAVGPWCVDWLSTLHCKIVVASGGRFHTPWIALVVSVVAAVLVPAQAAQLDQMVLPWSALPHSDPGPQPLRLVAVPGSPIAIGFDSYSVQRSETPAPAISTRLWSSEYGDVLFGLSVDEYQEGDSLFGDVGRDPKKKKTYRAILAFDQPLGFSTAISMDVLSKDQRRGLTKFQLLQIGVTHPFADGAGSPSEVRCS